MTLKERDAGVVNLWYRTGWTHVRLQGQAVKGYSICIGKLYQNLKKIENDISLTYHEGMTLKWQFATPMHILRSALFLLL